MSDAMGMAEIIHRKTFNGAEMKPLHCGINQELMNLLYNLLDEPIEPRFSALNDVTYECF